MSTSAGIKEFQRKLSMLTKAQVVLGAVGTHSEAGISNSDLILIHELGRGNQKARAPIRKTFGKQQVVNRIVNNFERSLEHIFVTGGDVKASLDLVGQQMMMEVKATINAGLQPPLSENYLEKKIAAGYSELPLVKTEQLINSFEYEVRLK